MSTWGSDNVPAVMEPPYSQARQLANKIIKDLSSIELVQLQNNYYYPSPASK